MRKTIVFLICVIVAAVFCEQIRLYNTIHVQKPAFLSLTSDDSGTIKTLFITTFYPFEKDAMYIIPHIEQLKEGKPAPAAQLVNTTSNVPFLWPNEVNYLPPFGNFKYGAITLGTGFLVPGKGKGSVFIFPFANAERTALDLPLSIINSTESSGEWFYHRALPVHFTSAPLDIVTCRAHKPIIGDWKSELVLLSALDSTGTRWSTQVLAEGGCDIFFNVADFDNDGNDEIVAPSFVNQQLILYWNKGKYWSKESIQNKIIDKNAGAFFEGMPAQLDGTGKIQYLATNHQYDKQTPPPSMYAYQLPSDIRSQPWNRTTIASGYPVVKTLVKGQAPGDAKTFFVQPQLTSGRPWIVLAGDGSQEFYIYEPVGGIGSLGYQLFYKENLGATIGDILVDDINGDGYNEIFVPVFEKSVINVYTFAPKQQ